MFWGRALSTVSEWNECIRSLDFVVVVDEPIRIEIVGILPILFTFKMKEAKYLFVLRFIKLKETVMTTDGLQLSFSHSRQT
jgi:hypothetical protein